MDSISQQFDKAVNNVLKDIYYYVIPQLVEFGIKMVNEVIPSQAEYRNLTGNTLTSYAFGVYYNGQLELMGFNTNSEPAIRNKLIKGETIVNFEDYDGDLRIFFRANIDTDGQLGTNTSMSFLKDYHPKSQFGIVFTTGTEYSAYLENVRELNVLSDAYDYSRSSFINSFRPIK